MDSKDYKIILISTLWTISNLAAYIFAEKTGIAVCNIIWVLLLFGLINFPPFMRWFFRG